jgi:hypothetical protein
MERLNDYLYSNGRVTDKNWLDNTLKPMFKKAFIHLAMLAKPNLLPKPNVYELYGLDFMLDD